jgi:murein DD-endopeptidase MepM/ murein hydrolase activator NlpD
MRMSSFSPLPVAREKRGKGPHHVIIARGRLVCTFKLHPWMAWMVCLGGLIFFSLYVGATAYWVFRDDILAASIARQSRIRFVYEDRIAELRAQIDRLTSRQLVDQEAIDAKVQRLLGRQAALDARQDLLVDLDAIARNVGVTLSADATKDKNRSAGIDPAVTGGTLRGSDGAAALSDAPLRESRLTDSTAPAGPDRRLGALETSLDQMEREQAAYVEAVAASINAKAAHFNTVISRLGHRVDPTASAGGVGGPYLPVAEGPRSFRQGVAAANDGIGQIAALRVAARQLPLRRPLASAEITSGFGTRLDPFFNKPSYHAGVDFRSDEGSSVRATAAGTVTEAGNSGGYGLMVEIDHGNGLTTRYAHLSSISVKAGDRVAVGAVVGHVGTTGRSTGPHLHYEVRVDGEALDPMRYIRAGQELRGLL